MKEKSTLVKYTREELAHVPDETDWEKVDTMSDEEVYQDARNDKDAQPTDKTFWEITEEGIQTDENAIN